jgi:hypothetical protein
MNLLDTNIMNTHTLGARNTVCVCGVALLACVFLTGCKPVGPEIASVEGLVTFDGEPLANASVMFIPQGGRPAIARTDSSGKYVLNFSGGRKGAIPGPNKVRISTVAEASEDENGNPIPASKERIPMQYNQTSTLEFNVEPGTANVANFELKSGGRVMSDDGGY